MKTDKMARPFQWLVLAFSMLILSIRAQQSAKLEFFNYSGMDVTVNCVDYPSRTLEAGATFSIPLTHSNQACIVTLKDGKYVSSDIGQVLPSSCNSGLSVSVDINDTFLFFALDQTVHHEYVSFVNAQESWRQIENSSYLQAWSIQDDE